MPRRIWVAEGVASDGDMYGRALQLPDGGGVAAPGDGRARRAAGTILKNHLGDIPSCPCLAALVPDDHGRAKEAVDA